ncbi:MAG: helix-turn-helix domain-containing protein [Magnetococcales bacterium]|nr:helix-turn-helix domain-containing protein [Magnetococcales bacterium]
MTLNQAARQGDQEALLDLPDSLLEIVEILGLGSTLQLVKSHGGTRLFIPKQAKVQHHLADLLGIEQARRLSNHFGGESLTIPRMANAMRGKRNREIVRRYDRGESVRVLAHAYNLTDRQIYTILSRPV